jgi:chromosome segregation ATPase
MAPSIAIAAPASGGWKSSKKTSVTAAPAAEGVAAQAEALRRRNAELEQEVAVLRAELEAARLRAEAAEEAEEQLCAQLGEAECEAVELARELVAARGHAGRR